MCDESEVFPESIIQGAAQNCPSASALNKQLAQLQCVCHRVVQCYKTLPGQPDSYSRLSHVIKCRAEHQVFCP